MEDEQVRVTMKKADKDDQWDEVIEQRKKTI